MEAFVEMSHFIRQNSVLLPHQEIRLLSARQDVIEGEVKDIRDNMVTRTDLADIMKLFETGISSEEILILDGEPFKADLAYQKIYRRAKRSIIVIDDYLGAKTLYHLAHAKDNVAITVISDNKGGRPLRQVEYNDFLLEYPGKQITFISSQNKAHDRYIVLDHSTKSVRIYHCGASSKDAGKKITTITELKAVDVYRSTVNALLTNPTLILR